MTPPSTTLDFALATVALVGSFWWFVRTRNDSRIGIVPKYNRGTGSPRSVWTTLVDARSISIHRRGGSPE
ncbi:hypothetical protein [Haladaptatus halobius]|uniref:hypothetical protein n=1 Tax=Haladaptatus halobius TaxID=2884875 RepID=UPI001D0A9800|nr:hypothetical protein [Haladaptatus halobius]